jgi:hypothetical protein
MLILGIIGGGTSLMVGGFFALKRLGPAFERIFPDW